MAESINLLAMRGSTVLVSPQSGSGAIMAFMTDRRTAAEVVDASVAGRLLIFGSLPPEGRDLDLLARPAELSAAGAALAGAEFVQAGRSWARFRACDADVVEFVPASRWGLPQDELDALFAEAQPLTPFRWLCQPAPHHVILILARRVVLARGRPPDKLHGRVEETLERTPTAWIEAERRAAAWRLRRGLQLLQTWHAGMPLSRTAWVGALGELAGIRARPRFSRRRTGVIALSGIDGAGKSTQAYALGETLEKLGHRSVVEWNPMSTFSTAIPRPFKDALLRMMGSADRAPIEGESADRARNAMSRQPGLVVHVLALGAALLAILAHWRLVLRHGPRGRLIIVDRYTLDASVHLRFRYGQSRALPIQLALLRWLSPKPIASFLLDVAPATAMSRKPHHWTAAEFELQAALYRDERERHRTIALNADRSQDQVCADLAGATWRHLA